jgi:hypothetical protein
MKLHPSIDAARVIQAVEGDDCMGLCAACGADAYGVEPDARKYECGECGAHAVYGAEEYLFMGDLA